MNKNVDNRIKRNDAPPGIIRCVFVDALGIGVLLGVSEMCWSYLLPLFKSDWRLLLPTSFGGISAFAASAIIVDIMLTLICGAGLLAILIPLLRLTSWSRTSSKVRTCARGLFLGGAAAYLYTGWTVLYILLSEHKNTFEYRLVVAGGALVAFLLGFLVSWLISLLQKWRQWISPALIWSCALLALIALLVPGVKRQMVTNKPPPEITPSTLRHRPNVVLVTLDTLRADYLACYGHPWIQTPNIDAVAARAVVFDDAISQAPSTAPSHCSIMTSVYPFDHESENGKPMKAGISTLADVLRTNAYETIAFISSTTTRSVNSGLHQGFDRYVDSLVPWSELFGRDEFQHLILFYVAGIMKHSQISGDVVSDRALRWLDRRSPGPFFVWLHYFDPHLPYGSPPPWKGMYQGRIADNAPMAAERERYAEDISYVDAQLGRVVDELKKRGLFDDTLFIIASDHGEAFGERHGDVVEHAHGHYLYDTTQHVPLIIKPAGYELQSRRVSEQVELIDIAPTVLDSIGVDPCSCFRGKPLTELLDGRPYSYAAKDAHSFNVIDVDRPGGKVVFVQQLAVRSPEWKYITRPNLAEEELYDLSSDPAERWNVLPNHGEIAAQRSRLIRPFWDENRDLDLDPRQRLAPALIRELQALGYLADDEEVGVDETDDGD